jgi:UDP-2-acetamido-3-amino-2,3-dideoxy-glucuronate N-acetyltransferase
VVSRDVPDFALVVGVPAKQIGWMSRVGERLKFINKHDGEAICPATGERYVMEQGLVRFADITQESAAEGTRG